MEKFIVETLKDCKETVLIVQERSENGYIQQYAYECNPKNIGTTNGRGDVLLSAHELIATGYGERIEEMYRLEIIKSNGLYVGQGNITIYQILKRESTNNQELLERFFK